MKRTTLRTFLTRWLTLTALGAAWVLIFTTGQPTHLHDRQRALVEEAVISRGEAARQALEAQGPAAATAVLSALERPTGVRVFLFEDGQLTAGGFAPEAALTWARRGQARAVTGSTPQHQVWSLPLSPRVVAVAFAPHRSPLRDALAPEVRWRRLLLALGLTALLAALSLLRRPTSPRG